jgi:AraC family ethanolamine operon transcriptional activator
MTDQSANLISAPNIASRTFTDIEQAEALMNRKRPAKITPLSLASFRAHVDQADFGELLLFFADVSSPIHRTGARRAGFIQFGTALATTQEAIFNHGQPITTDTLHSFDRSRDTDMVIRAHILISDVHIQQDLFEATCQAMRRDDLNARFFRQDWIQAPTTLRVYQAYLRDLLHLIKTKSPLLSQPDYRQMVLGDLLPILIDAIPRQKTLTLSAASPSQRTRLARQARDFIHDNLDQPLTLKDIYTAIGTSRQTLYYSFESLFGMTPIAYLKLQRLLGVRRSLKQADPQATSITKIAHQWGFWSLNHFAKAYQAQFGELPSETLKR